mmetsp:Transcript_26996/g.63383  ORF Transcript_26996/g.63383 Transcript_26996/m.63383 type:complete len:393 (-) Transcript_26996:365-1543(-)
MVKRRKRRHPSSSATKRTKTKAKNGDSILCFQDVWEEYCSKGILEDEDDTMDARISNVFFELANAPSVSYRLDGAISLSRSHPPLSKLGDLDDTDTTKAIRDAIGKKGTNTRLDGNNTIVIHQDVLGAAQNHTGGIVWETSYLLLNYLLSSNDWLGTCSKPFTPITMLEIGAGCGMLGLALHKAFELGVLERNNDGNGHNASGVLSSSRVILTETNEVIENLRGNLELNYPSPSSEETTEKPPPVSKNQVSVEQLDWTRFQEDCALAKINAHSIDCIVGTDVVFSTRFVLPMLETLRFLSHSRTVIYLCLQERCRDSHRLLLQEATGYGFRVDDISETVYQDERLARFCSFGRALECKLFRFTVVVIKHAPAYPPVKKKEKKKKSKKEWKEK